MNKEREILKKKLEKQLKDIRQEEEDEVVALHYPHYKQLIGRYFKRTNVLYGITPVKKYYTYTKITDIKKNGIVLFPNGKDVYAYFSGYSFECDCNGCITINKIKVGHVSDVGDEITGKEFKIALGKLMSYSLPAIIADNPAIIVDDKKKK